MAAFSEEQKFNQPLLKIFMLVTLAIVLAPFILSWQELKYSEPTFWITVGASILTFAIFIFLIFILKLKTRVDAKGVHYRFFPVMTKEKSYLWQDISACYVRKYKPIREFGGWGYRISLKKGKAINVRGKHGLQLVLKNGKKILIGTQKQEAMAAAVEQYCTDNN